MEKTTYELTICGEKESFVLDYEENEFYTMVQVAERLIKKGLTIRMRILDYE